MAHCCTFFLFFLVVSGVSSANFNGPIELDSEFDSWLNSDAGITAIANGYYDPEDRDFGIQRFELGKDRVAALQRENPTAQFSMQTPFALMTSEEFMAYVAQSGLSLDVNANFTTNVHIEKADAIDWVTDPERSKCVSHVKDQGKCGSCWAFSAVGALESTYCALGHQLLNLAEQQLVSCDTTNHGCNGGLLTPAYNWIAHHNNGGLCLADDYEYTASNSKCKTKCHPKSLGVKGSIELHSEQEVLEKLKLHPIAVAVHADSKWQHYSGGVLIPSQNSRLNHAVIVVGYGSDSSKAYWKIRNSWSASWGEEGYIRVKAGQAFGKPTYPTF